MSAVRLLTILSIVLRKYWYKKRIRLTKVLLRYHSCKKNDVRGVLWLGIIIIIIIIPIAGRNITKVKESKLANRRRIKMRAFSFELIQHPVRI